MKRQIRNEETTIFLRRPAPADLNSSKRKAIAGRTPCSELEESSRESKPFGLKAVRLNWELRFQEVTSRSKSRICEKRPLKRKWQYRSMPSGFPQKRIGSS